MDRAKLTVTQMTNVKCDVYFYFEDECILKVKEPDYILNIGDTVTIEGIKYVILDDNHHFAPQITVIEYWLMDKALYRNTQQEKFIRKMKI